MKANLCELQVLVHGKPVREFQHEGRLFLEGRKGTDFTLRLKNLTRKRILAVVSIDGLSITTGEEASTKEGGYVLGPRETLNVPGWSLNNDEVARFFFHKAAESYAAKTGKPRNVGVIGAAIFKEKPTHHSLLRGVTLDMGGYSDPNGTGGTAKGPVFQTFYCNTSGGVPGPETTFTSSSHAAPGEVNCNAVMDSCTVEPSEVERGVQASNQVKGQIETASEIGTGFGRRQGFRVQEVSFERENQNPDEVMEITYDTRKGLEKRGVDLNWRPTVARPSPFPGDSHCKPPAGWNG
jgi:hypothetical protein